MGSLRSLRSLALAGALALFAGTGCFLDEIDKSMELYPGNAAAAKAKEQEKQKAKQAAAAPAPNAGASAGGPSWWEKARTIGPELSDATITTCSLGGRTEFMRRDDCLSRGGRPQ